MVYLFVTSLKCCVFFSYLVSDFAAFLRWLTSGEDVGVGFAAGVKDFDEGLVVLAFLAAVVDVHQADEVLVASLQVLADGFDVIDGLSRLASRAIIVAVNEGLLAST